MDVSKIGLDGDGCGQDSNSPQELCRFWSPNGLFLVSRDPKLTHRKCQFLLRFESIPEYKVLTTKVPQPAMTQHRGDGRETVLVQLQARCAQGGPGLCPLAGWEDPPSHPPTGTGRFLQIGSMSETKGDSAVPSVLCLCAHSSTEALTCQACWPWGQLPSKTVLVHECVLQKSWHHLKTKGRVLCTSVTGHMDSILCYSGERSETSQPVATLSSHWDAQSRVPV